MIGKPGILLLVIALAAGSSSLQAQTLNSGLRGSTPAQ
jgi:nitrate reductase (cytochrome), electron transfer subunit